MLATRVFAAGMFTMRFTATLGMLALGRAFTGMLAITLRNDRLFALALRAATFDALGAFHLAAGGHLCRLACAVFGCDALGHGVFNASFR